MFMIPTPEQRETIAALNDSTRVRIGIDSTVWYSHGVLQLSEEDHEALRACVTAYDSWNVGTDTRGERDFGVIFQHGDGTWTGYTPDGEGWLNVVFWQISYHDLSLSRPSAAPWDADVTARVIMLMLADEYD